MSKRRKTNSRSKVIWTSVERLAFQQKIRHRIEQHFRDRYIEQSLSGVSVKRHTRRFSKLSQQLRDILLEHSLTSLAIVDGGEKVTDVLQELGFRESEFNTQELTRLSILILRAQVFITIVSQADLEPEIKTKLIDRYISQLVPTRITFRRKSRRIRILLPIIYFTRSCKKSIVSHAPMSRKLQVTRSRPATKKESCLTCRYFLKYPVSYTHLTLPTIYSV